MHGLVSNRKKRNSEHTYISHTKQRKTAKLTYLCLHTGIGMLVLL